jgi:hypothetical protein
VREGAATPSSTAEPAMQALLVKARMLFGEREWGEWTWDAQEYGTREPRSIRYRYQAGVFLPLSRADR